MIMHDETKQETQTLQCNISLKIALYHALVASALSNSGGIKQLLEGTGNCSAWDTLCNSRAS